MAGKGGGGEVDRTSLRASSSLGVTGDQALLSAALISGEVDDDETKERCSRNLVALCHDLRVLERESAIVVSSKIYEREQESGGTGVRMNGRVQ